MNWLDSEKEKPPFNEEVLGWLICDEVCKSWKYHPQKNCFCHDNPTIVRYIDSDKHMVDNGYDTYKEPQWLPTRVRYWTRIERPDASV